MDNSNNNPIKTNKIEDYAFLDEISDEKLIQLLDNPEFSTEKIQVETVNNEIINALKEKFKFHEAKMLAFLNIEFNILNKKMINCNKGCYNIDKTISQVNTCLSNCRFGISKAHKFTVDLQNSLVSSNETCLQGMKNTKTAKDINLAFVDCYEQLMVKFQESEKILKSEYSNYL